MISRNDRGIFEPKQRLNPQGIYNHDYAYCCCCCCCCWCCCYCYHYYYYYYYYCYYYYYHYYYYYYYYYYTTTAITPTKSVAVFCFRLVFSIGTLLIAGGCIYAEQTAVVFRMRVVAVLAL